VPTHGSLSKAGKTRSSTPRVEKRERKKKSPKVNNRKKYHKRVILGQETGQPKTGQRKRRKRRR